MLNTKVGKLKLENPTVLASGILGVSAGSMLDCARHGIGAVTTKSLGPQRKGHPLPVVLEWGNGLINAVGLSNAGAKNFAEEIKEYKEKTDVPIIASIFAPTVKEFGKYTQIMTKMKPDMIEVNISCPNVHDEFGRAFGLDKIEAAKVTKIVKKYSKQPIAVKLSPNVHNIGEIAKAVEKAGADAITAINTVGPGMCIDIETCRPILSNKVGGVSGPAIKPIAIRCVYQIYEAVKIPIIGLGGITSGKDAVEMIMAGASAVGIGSGVYYRGIDIFENIKLEMEAFMIKEGYKSIKEMVGRAH